jgi:ATP-binding cassette subfamily B protein
LLLVWPIEAMGYILASGQEAATAAQRVYEIRTRPAITDPRCTPLRPRPPRPGQSGTPCAAGSRRAPPGSSSTGSSSAIPVPGRPSRGLPGAGAGQDAALTGATGAGKTTLLQLVPRLADPVAGRIVLDGTDVRALPLATLRTRVGCAFEEATLFSASVGRT